MWLQDQKTTTSKNGDNPRHFDSKTFFQRTKSRDIEIPKTNDIKIPRLKSRDIKFSRNSDSFTPWYPVIPWYLGVPGFIVCHETVWRIFELRKGTKRPQCNSNFMNKIGGRSNTVFSSLDMWNSTWSPIRNDKIGKPKFKTNGVGNKKQRY